ncbi:MAG: sterol desaturase family protein [Bacteroidia bacterium]|nr:sterol desaturase family protein [Bacteroidia bacterium]
MPVNLIKLSIPIFLGLVGVELIALWVLRRPYIRLNDSIADLACGILSQLADIFTKGVQIFFFYLVWQHLRLQHLGLPELPLDHATHGWVWAAVTWSVGFVLIDLAYYWYHRTAHEVNFFWAVSHIVHHQSEEYNLTVALRQSAFGGFVSWLFYLPIALLGFPWEVFATCYALNLIYQFWIHTRLIGRMPRWFEAVMNTPSHHRVHHGRNPKYIDKNYAGVFIVWDRLFGTYQPEEDEPAYGLTKPLRSWNPLWANLHAIWDLFTDAWRTRRWADKLRVFYMPPGYKPPDLGGPGPHGGVLAPPYVDRSTQTLFNPPVVLGVRAYVLLQFAAIVAVALPLFGYSYREQPLEVGVGVFFVTLTLVNLGGLLENRRWAYLSDLARLATACVAALWLLVADPAQWFTPAVGVLGLAALSGLWLLRLEKRLGEPVQVA